MKLPDSGRLCPVVRTPPARLAARRSADRGESDRSGDEILVAAGLTADRAAVRSGFGPDRDSDASECLRTDRFQVWLLVRTLP
ncbi:hypothetical protein ACFR9U_14030 [Halorientalis brevis]|uniref:Uncharacterized protein n=1 Tax=Halorientalis brevis TaxID=1126241 RepID=A0ABD6CFB7_9EURY|nr:hypothetical protein [Halorientalis brevis]